MHEHDATEYAWKNGYVTALGDVERNLDNDKEVLKRLFDKLLEYRGIIKASEKTENISTEM